MKGIENILDADSGYQRKYVSYEDRQSGCKEEARKVEAKIRSNKSSLGATNLEKRLIEN